MKAAEVKGTQFNSNIMDFNISEKKPEEVEATEVEDNFDRQSDFSVLTEDQNSSNCVKSQE
jgi:hypothetical protein